MANDAHDLAMQAKAWPFEEARKVLKRINGNKPEKGYVLFETGYGPSGLPHIGTFGEVLRTSMVRRAFQEISDVPTRLYAFSDDLDGFRSVPDNIPKQEMMAEHLGKPLTSVPDPFGTHESFGAHNNARLQAFLDDFGFDYEFVSATECYSSGRFDDALMQLLRHYNDIMGIMLPSLGEERQKTYSPFLPVCERTSRVLQVPVLETNPDAGTIVYQDENGAKIETPVTGGRCKIQWKPDWAMRWYALGVDYEMSGKDLIDSVNLSGRICRTLGGRPPENYTYELFLDENGEKISKSRGNGLTIEEWLTYATNDSLALFMFQKPRTAKRLHFDVIPKTVDEYLTFLRKYSGEDDAKQLTNPSWHIYAGEPPIEDVPVSFNLLLNLASVCNTEDASILWGFITRYAPEATPENDRLLDELVGRALNYYRDFVKPQKKYRIPHSEEINALSDLLTAFKRLPSNAPAGDIQNEVYAVGKAHNYENLRDWFKALYEILLGQEEGPRMGSFVALYGLDETKDLLRRAINGENLAD